MVAKWPEQPRLLGKDHQRIDGFEKASGKAKYSFDINLPGLLHASILRCPHAHAKLTKLDTSKAEKAPGVKLKTSPEVAEIVAPAEETSKVSPSLEPRISRTLFGSS